MRTGPRSSSYLALAGPFITIGPTTPSPYWAEKWLSEKLVPYLVIIDQKEEGFKYGQCTV